MDRPMYERLADKPVGQHLQVSSRVVKNERYLWLHPGPHYNLLLSYRAIARLAARGILNK